MNSQNRSGDGRAASTPIDAGSTRITPTQQALPTDTEQATPPAPSSLLPGAPTQQPQAPPFFLTRTSTTAERSSTARIWSMDVFRGLIMLLMAWDHTQEFLLTKHTEDAGGEMWSGKFKTYDHSRVEFFCRFVSHVCAPGFFLTMGIGMFLWTKSTLERGTMPDFAVNTMEGYVRKYFLIRGLILILCGRLINICEAGYMWVFYYVLGVRDIPSPFGPNIDPVLLKWFPLIGIWQVLVGLGLSMMLAGLFAPLVATGTNKNGTKAGVLLMVLLAVSVLATSSYLIVEAQNGNPSDGDSAWPKAFYPAETFQEILLRFLVLPGRTSFGVVAYPLFPWVSLVFLGMCIGVLFQQKKFLGIYFDTASNDTYVGTSSSSQTSLRILRNGRSSRNTNASGSGRFFYLESLLAIIGLQLLTVFFFVRFRINAIVKQIFGSEKAELWDLEKYFNFRGYPRGEYDSPFRGMFTFCKYPPDLAYLLFTAGVNFVLWWLFCYDSGKHQVEKRRKQPQNVLDTTTSSSNSSSSTSSGNESQQLTLDSVVSSTASSANRMPFLDAREHLVMTGQAEARQPSGVVDAQRNNTNLQSVEVVAVTDDLHVRTGDHLDANNYYQNDEIYNDNFYTAGGATSTGQEELDHVSIGSRWCFFPKCLLKSFTNVLHLITHILGNFGRFCLEERQIFKQCKAELTTFLFCFGSVPLFFYVFHYMLLGVLATGAKVYVYKKRHQKYLLEVLAGNININASRSSSMLIGHDESVSTNEQALLQQETISDSLAFYANPKPQPDVELHWPRWVLVLIWLAVVLVLRRPCELYYKFKRRQSRDSVWRLF
ncbi:unnamed protein product [Amoebophrya sp. A120]|nr:unnamed protein product [Amoebophrya sp. A120]|eukprot:GSA120T00010435001.1